TSLRGRLRNNLIANYGHSLNQAVQSHSLSSLASHESRPRINGRTGLISYFLSLKIVIVLSNITHIVNLLQSNTILGLFVGQNVITLPVVDSTNEYLKKELSKSTPFTEGTVIMAVHQAAGRGQKGSVWHSEDGKNLTFSILLTPSFLKPAHQFRLTVAISLAVAKWLTTLLQLPIRIKWPND